MKELYKIKQWESLIIQASISILSLPSHTHPLLSLSLSHFDFRSRVERKNKKQRERYVLCSLWLSSSLSLSKLVLWLPFLLLFFGTGSSLFFSVSDLVRSYHSITVPNLQLPSIRPYLLQFWHFCLSFWYHIHGFSFNCIMDLPFHCTPCFSVFISCFEIMGMLNFNHYQMGILKQNVFCLDLLILENSKKVACVLVLHCFAVFKLDEFHAVPMLWWEFIGTICFLLCLRCMCFFFFSFLWGHSHIAMDDWEEKHLIGKLGNLNDETFLKSQEMIKIHYALSLLFTFLLFNGVQERFSAIYFVFCLFDLVRERERGRAS